MLFAINFRFLSRPVQLKGCQILILNLMSFGRYLDLFLHKDLLINLFQFFISCTKLVFPYFQGNDDDHCFDSEATVLTSRNIQNLKCLYNYKCFVSGGGRFFLMGLGVSVTWGMSCTHLPSPSSHEHVASGQFEHAFFSQSFCQEVTVISSITHLKFSFLDKNISLL